MREGRTLSSVKGRSRNRESHAAGIVRRCRELKILATALLVLGSGVSALPAGAQDSTVEILTAKRATKWITLALTPTRNESAPFEVKYFVDTKEPLHSASLKDSVTLLGSSALPVYVLDYSPFSVEASMEVVADKDPAVAALEAFVASANPVLSGIGVAVEDEDGEGAAEAAEKKTTAKKSLRESVKRRKAARPSGDVGDNALEVFRAAEAKREADAKEDELAAREGAALARVKSERVIDWFLAYTRLGRHCVSDLEAGTSYWEEVVDASLIAYQAPEVDSVLTSIKSANTRSSLLAAKSTLEEFVRVVEAQAKADREGVAGLKAVPDFNTHFSDDCVAFALKTERFASAVSKEAEGALDKRVMLAKGLRDLATALGDTAGRFADERHYFLGEIQDDLEKRRTATVAIKKRELKLDKETGKVSYTTSDKTTTRKIVIRNYLIWAPEFSAGAVFANVDYPAFGTKEIEFEADGETMMKTVVAEASPDSDSVHLAGLLNLVFRTGGRSVHPMIQLGIGIGENRPSLLIGGGFRLTQAKKLSISFGAVFPFVKDLTDLKVCDESAPADCQALTGTAELESDLKSRLQDDPELYVGLSWKLSG